MLLNHVSVLVVAESLLDEKAHQVERDAFVQPSIGPLLGGDEAAIKLKKISFFKLWLKTLV
jgi:hypothetical protein